MSSLLIRGARIWGSSDAPVDVLAGAGRIARIEPAGAIPGADQVIAADGRHIGPGLWDSHVHFTQWTTTRSRVDLSLAASAADALRVAAAAVAVQPCSAPVVGYGFRDALWADAPSAAAIDAVAGEAPVVLVSGDLHCAWISRAAEQLLGVTREPDGVVRESAFFAVHGRLTEIAPLSDDAFRGAARNASARGVVGIIDLEHADNPREWADRGSELLRVEAAVWPDRLDQAIDDGLRSGGPLTDDGLVTVGPLKIVVDGSLNTRTAWCWHPYPGTSSAGVASVGPDDLRSLMQRASANGFDLAVHAIGDRANAEALDAFAELGITGAIEHAQLVDPGDFARFAELGIVAGVQPEHAMDDRDVAERHWPGRSERAFAFGSLRRAGARLRLGSDAPVAPLDPWISIAAAVSRSRDGRDPWHPDERISIADAIAASTRTRVAVGEAADLVLTDLDPYAATPDELRAMPVSATVLGGRVAHSGA
ncbi:amidohydrolase [Microbacterium indicum]|uniref:amidohydrolase n=1 Tax=Microbacterium indicum TaxID=358100 RepID=UPI0004152DD0|nr:amidohydrolase family protein [Microbacterium indicum]